MKKNLLGVALLTAIGAAAMDDARAVGNALNSAAGKTSVAVGSLALSGGAMAEGFDGAAIVTTIGLYVAAGVTILTAFVVGRWTLKAFGVIK